MKTMSSSTVEPTELLDLRLLPAWVKESAEPGSYKDYTGEEEHGPRDGRPPPRDKRDRKSKRSTPNAQRPTFNKAHAREPGEVGRDRRARRRDHPRQEQAKQNRENEDRRALPAAITVPLTIRFLPYSRVLENVVAQIKSGSVAYSIFALARL